MHTAAQPKTNELVEILLEAISSKTTFSEFEIAYHKREAERLPLASHTHLVLCLLYVVLHQPKQCVSNGVEAVRLGQGDSAIIGNVILAFAMVGACRSLYDLLKSIHPSSLSQPVIANYVHASLMFFDAELTLKGLKLLGGNQFEAIRNNFEKKYERVKYAQENYGLDENDLIKVTLLAAEVVEENHWVLMTESWLYLLAEENKCLLSINVVSEPENLFELNWALSCKLVDANLIDRPLVVRFDTSQQSPKVKGLF